MSVQPRWKGMIREFVPPIMIRVKRQIADRLIKSRPRPTAGRSLPGISPVARAGDGKMTRHDFLAGIHAALQPRTYLEIGVNVGTSMALSRANSIGVDPAFNVTTPIQCNLALIRATSDDFFAMPDPLAHFRARSDGADVAPAPVVDLAFIDGMHLLEYALNDVINTELHAAWWSVIVLDDVLPRDDLEASRNRTTVAWTGDVFKIVEILAENRPDLIVLTVDTSPTGVALVLGADDSSRVLRDRYDGIVREWVKPDPQLVPAPILAREGALDPGALLASPLWALLSQARSEQISRPEGLARIREAVAAVQRP